MGERYAQWTEVASVRMKLYYVYILSSFRRVLYIGITSDLGKRLHKVVEDWLTERRQLWEARLDRFDRYVQNLKEKESES